MFPLLKQTFNFFLFSSLYIALCAVFMIYGTTAAFSFLLPYHYIGFIFFGCLCSYNFHWYLTPFHLATGEKAQWSHVNKTLHLLLFLIGLAGALAFGLKLTQHWLWIGAGTLLTFLYSAPKLPLKPFAFLKRIAIAKTAFLALAWTYVTVILPFILSNETWQAEHYLFTFNRFYLLYAICLLFDYRDKEEDVKEGIRSMVTQLDENGIDLIFWGSLFFTMLSGTFLFFTSFSKAEGIFLLLPSIILLLLYPYSKRTKSDFYFYFILDGLMMLSGILHLFFQF